MFLCSSVRLACGDYGGGGCMCLWMSVRESTGGKKGQRE